MDQPLLDGYWMALSDWPMDEFEAAAKQLMKTSKFLPRPADFNAIRNAGKRTAGEAFAQARKIVRSLNPREMISHRSGDPQLDAAIHACGGYEALGMCESDNIGFFERRFCEHYDSIGESEATREALPQITGGPRLNGTFGLAQLMKDVK